MSDKDDFKTLVTGADMDIINGLYSESYGGTWAEQTVKNYTGAALQALRDRLKAEQDRCESIIFRVKGAENSLANELLKVAGVKA